MDEATFGWVMTMGKIGAVGGDTEDDLVVASLNQDLPAGGLPHVYEDLGAIYTFVDNQLGQFAGPNFQLTPSVGEYFTQ